MSVIKRTIKNYDTDLIAVIDICKAMDFVGSLETRKRVLTYVVQRELGEQYEIVKRGL